MFTANKGLLLKEKFVEFYAQLLHSKKSSHACSVDRATTKFPGKSFPALKETRTENGWNSSGSSERLTLPFGELPIRTS